ncbi:hypothetical protein FACS1894205_2710 [Alphaproteobacteria bacterium]|nr:hypothetical protein FACS1894205_2710 [Alphaproteobacteria bacterium]
MHPGKGVCASLRLFVALAGCFGLVACSELNLASYVFKEAAGPSLSGKGGYKVGRPYEINGVWYTPAEDYNYSETGIASWYGAAFHGKSTANGEIFNQSDVTAAHRTLPMPCFVRVTNLGNGRSLVVRVNDRGPFAHGRIIDLSRRSAQLLGFEREGTARVRVEIMAKESRALAMQLQGATAKKSSSSPVRPVAVDQTVKQGNATATQMFLQAGAFSRYENASRLSAALSFLGRTSITEVETAKGKLFRVRMGPIASLDDADRLLETIISSGSPGARIVVD